MELALALVALAVTVLAGTAIAEWLRIPPALLLIAAGVAASYVPGVPTVRLEPEVVLVGLLPPLLYATAVRSSLVDFRANKRAILLLSVGLVMFTALGVGAVVHLILPVDWPAALAIGAVVAPPDAVAATAIARRIGLPRRLVTILEGESLLNDATALVALRAALAAGAGGFSLAGIGLDFLVAAGGGIGVGLLFFVVVGWVRKHVTDPLLDTSLSFVVPFAAYLAAEEIHASGVLAVVVAALLLGHKAAVLQTASSRITERTTWNSVAFLLENAVFFLIGLQASWILDDVAGSDLGLGRIALACGATLLAVVVLRLLWVFPARYLLVRPGADRATGRPPPWTFTFVLGWTGMRGVVTLAAAFVIPAETPHREVLLLIAFTAVAGTLLLQGTTLPLVARRLRVPAPDPADDALARATLLQQASKAGLAVLEQSTYDDAHGVTDLLRQRLDQRNFAAWERLGTTADVETPSELYARVRLAMLAAERARVLEIRSLGEVPAEIVSGVLDTLDVEESILDAATRARAELKAGRPVAAAARADACDDLAHFPAAAQESATECASCLLEGTLWVALRRCLACGHVGCCDSSTGQHATRHFEESGHPVMQSAEPGEEWRWCYVHHLTG